MVERGPIRVLQILGIVAGGGVESVIMNYYEHIDKTKVQFDFIVHSDNVVDVRHKVEAMGGKVYKVTPYYINPMAFIYEIYQIIKKEDYKIIHSNMNTLSALSLFAACLAKVPVRILHNHSISVPGEWKRNLMKYIFRPFAKLFATQYWACGKSAARWIYGDKNVDDQRVGIIHNAINLKLFNFDERRRFELRRRLGIEKDDFVIGHVGRFVHVKNHGFLITIFAKFHDKHKNAKLILIGDGPLRREIEEKVHSLGLANCVIFGGLRNDVANLYNLMDLLLLPSLSEGFPVVGLEAQANGLPIIVSDAVTTELAITNLIIFESLSASVDRWVMDIESLYNR